MSFPAEFGHGYISCVWLACFPADDQQCQSHRVKTTGPLEVVAACYTRKVVLFRPDSLE